MEDLSNRQMNMFQVHKLMDFQISTQVEILYQLLASLPVHTTPIIFTLLCRN